MKRASLGLRLAGLAFAGALVVLIVVGLAIAGLLRNFVVETYQTNLNATLVALMANTQFDPDLGRLSVNVAVADPRFEQPLSGWYWQISDADDVLVRSGSLWTRSLDVPVSGTVATGPENATLYLLSRSFTAPGGGGRLIASAAMPQAEIEADIRAMLWPLGVSLGLLALGMALAILFQVRFGLAPLAALTGQLRAIRHGTRDRLDPVPYRELAPLVGELNTLLETNAKTIERAQHPDRNAQFRYLNEQARDHRDAGDPVISVDSSRMLPGPSHPGRVAGTSALSRVPVSDRCGSSR